MNANYFKVISNKNKNNTKKNNNKSFLYKKPFKAIYNNKNFTLSGNISNSSYTLKNNDISLFQPKAYYKIKKNVGKQNNNHSANKRIYLPLEGINLKNGIKSYSHYNIFTIPTKAINSRNDNTFTGINIAKVTKLNNLPKINLTKALNKNNLNGNNRSYNNIHYKNNNLNQLYNLNLINKNELFNNNNILTDRNSINNNYLTMPKVNTNSQILSIRIGSSIDDNSQNIIDIGDEQKTTAINDMSRYSIINNNNSFFQNERLTTGYKLDNNNENNIVEELTNNYNNNLNLENNNYLDNILNNSSSFQTYQDDSQNASLNDIINKLASNGNNLSYDNYLENYQNNNNFDINPYSQLLKCYTQNRKNNDNKKGVLLKDFGALTRPGNDESGFSKINQDAYISKMNINGVNNFNIFGVLDGHGLQGQYVSEFASEYIPNKIITDQKIRINSNVESIYNNLIEDDYKIIKNAFISTDKELDSLNFNSRNSGTTCVIIIHIGNHLICANVGDSRAIVAFDEQNDQDLKFLRAIPLSVDFKPDLPEENERILFSGGVVRQIKNNFGEGVGPFRVFARGKDYPGLAMSRSIGDLFGKKLGIISEPGITEYYIGNNTKFFVLCSDGVWEFLSNEKVRDIGKQFYLNSNANEFCQELISRSLIEWQTHDLFVDDITAVAAFF